MAHLTDELYTLCERLTETVSEINSKLKSGKGALPSADLDYVDKMTHALKSIKTIIAMEEAEEDDYSENYYYGERRMRGSDRDGRSHARGRRNTKRDSMDRYSRDEYSDRGYSRGMAKDEMVDDLREMMKQTDDDRVRQEMQSLISRMESMR